MADNDRGRDDGKKGDGRSGRGKGREPGEEQNLLEDWDRLNQNPPHVGELKKKPARKTAEQE